MEYGQPLPYIIHKSTQFISVCLSFIKSSPPIAFRMGDYYDL